MLNAITLPLRFDPVRLSSDLELIQASEWMPHYNERDYGGEWHGVALRSADGSAANLVAQAPAFQDTPLISRCTYLAQVIRRFNAQVLCVRLLSLAPGSYIREHTDHALGYEDGQVRIHVPIQTSDSVDFYLAGERLLLEPGGTYYLNVKQPHRVNNRGTSARVHLVIDMEVNDWVADLFGRGTRTSISERFLPPLHAFEDLQPPGWTPADVDAFVQAIRRGDPQPAEDGPIPRGWLPVRMHGEVVEWIRAGARRLVEPFYEDTIRVLARTPYNAAVRRYSRLESIEDAVPPAGLIFHASRCGSTLVSQMIAEIDGTTVVSEAPPIDQVLQSGLGIEALRKVVSGFGDRPILKLDAWHIHKFPIIREAFPDTPWVFVGRDLDEIVTSQLKAPGMHCLRGAMDPAVLGLSTDDITGLTPEQWCRTVIRRILAASREVSSDGGLYVDYSELPGAVFNRICPHFGLHPTPEQRTLMEERSRYHGKTREPWVATLPATSRAILMQSGIPTP